MALFGKSTRVVVATDNRLLEPRRDLSWYDKRKRTALVKATRQTLKLVLDRLEASDSTKTSITPIERSWVPRKWPIISWFVHYNSTESRHRLAKNTVDVYIINVEIELTSPGSERRATTLYKFGLAPHQRTLYWGRQANLKGSNSREWLWFTIPSLTNSNLSYKEIAALLAALAAIEPNGGPTNGS